MSDKMAIQVKVGKLNALSSVPGVVSMISIALSFIDGLRAIFITVAAVFAAIFVIIRYRNADKVPLAQQALDTQFQRDYVCPACGSFLGHLSYDTLLQNGACPKCKTTFKP